MAHTYLHDGWQLTWREAAPAGPADLAGADWRPASVPGCVLTSPFGLPREQLYAGDNVTKVAWLATKHWVYRRAVTVPTPGPDEQVRLRFAGIDYRFRIYVDGLLCVSDEGMFHDVYVPLGTYAGQTVEVVVIIEPPPPSTAAQLETTKAQFTRGWDWAPVLRMVGIWDEVTLEVLPALRVETAFIDTRLANRERALVTVRAEFSERIAAGTLVVELCGQVRHVPLFGAADATVLVEVPSPALWWPNGLGAATLHELRLTLEVAGRRTPIFTQRVGLREVARVPAAGQRPEDIPLQFVINGVPFFINGMNWVPAECCYGDLRDEQYERPLAQFAAGHVNLVRVWGGGLCEKRYFYNRCDELGLLVMQEYPIACGLGKSDAWLRQLAREAAFIARKLRVHPSVFLFTGGNENYHIWENLDSDEPHLAAARDLIAKVMPGDLATPNREWLAGAIKRYDEPAHLITGGVTAALAPNCLYQNTSGMEGEGEVHGIWTWNPRLGDHRFRGYASIYEYWLSANQHLYSEASVSSAANIEAFRAVLGAAFDGQLAPTSDPVWKLHHAYHAAWDNLPELWLDLPAATGIFGPVRDVAEAIAFTQYLQAEGGRFMIEELRRQQPRTTGVIWWGANDAWPSLAGNTLIDYEGRPKRSWPVIANALAPTILSLRYPGLQPQSLRAELWLSCNARAGFSGTYLVTTAVDGVATSDRYAGHCALGYQQALQLKRLLPTRIAPGTCLTIHTELRDDAGALVHTNRYHFGTLRAAVLREFGGQAGGG